MYAIYVLDPQHHFMAKMADLGAAKRFARDLVEKGYAHAEVWDAIIPLWSVWCEGTRNSWRICTSDDLVANA
jgi:hypothetical protein